jgi:transcription elongation factor GreA
MTLKGKRKIESDLKNLVEVERPSVIRAIEEARSHGDISENAEFHAAKERQSYIEGKIRELSAKIASSEVIDPSSLKLDKVAFGATVTVLNVESGVKVKYQIVGEDEADVKTGSISIMSPIARALIGKKNGNLVEVNTHRGFIEYEIINIEYV